MLVAYAVTTNVIPVDLDDIIDRLRCEMIPKMVNDNGNSFFYCPQSMMSSSCTRRVPHVASLWTCAWQ